MKKRFLSIVLTAVLSLSLVACGGGSSDSGETKENDNKDSGSSSSEVEMNLAMVTDSADITDQSFNQTTYETLKKWAEENGKEFQYYKPEADSNEARNASVDQAVANGANIVVLPGYMFANTIVTQSVLYPDVKFVALDVSEGDIIANGVGEGYSNNPDDYDVADYYNSEGVYSCTYQEEISGYMAGYCTVKLGYKKLGFLGGMSLPTVNRFGYGFVQGADAAAKELGVENEVSVEYVAAGQFYGDADITAYMDTWYGSKGVEAVFACGGGVYTSAAEAAAKVGGKVVGVDSDQAPIIDEYQEGMTITSAMKGLSPSIITVLNAIRDGKWDEFAGRIDNLGLASDNVEENYVQLPLESTQWNDDFTKDDYTTLVKDIRSGKITVSNDVSALPETAITVTDYGSIK